MLIRFLADLNKMTDALLPACLCVDYDAEAAAM